MEKTIKLKKIDLLYIKSILHTEKTIKQAELEELDKIKNKKFLDIDNYAHTKAELEQIENILKKL